MDSKKFMDKHIITDKVIINEVISNIIWQHQEYARLFILLQKESVSKILITLIADEYLVAGKLKGIMTERQFRYYINLLLATDLIEQTNDIKYKKINNQILNNTHIANNSNYYILSEKGEDFINLYEVKIYLTENYKSFWRIFE